MSTSISIPPRRRHIQSNASASTSSSSSTASTNNSPDTFWKRSTSDPVPDNSAAPLTSPTLSDGGHSFQLPSQPRRERRMSLLSDSLSRVEHIVVNIGSPEAPRLITSVRSSQGFDWNQELFLPAHYGFEHTDFEHRQEPVEDIILTDEESATMLPS